MLFVTKSTRSKNERPKIVMCDNEPNDKALGIPSKKMKIPTIHAVRARLTRRFPITVETTISSNEIADVIVANNNKMKKIIKKKLPNGICSKTAGKMTKTSPGPWSGSKPNANTAGKMTSPASNEMKMFIAATFTPVPPMFSFLPRYDAYVIMIDIPTLNVKNA